ncbi:hypothetical protein [Phaeovulum sp.]|uniref:hypothetical protein n=1 Tax=Phaeovulum sp. TaxID=2934796 RepID=UPI0039E5CCD1
MKLALIIALPVILAGCADPGFVGVPDVVAVSQVEVAGCTHVSNISMTPAVYGPILATQGQQYARNKVLETARGDGANRVVFEKTEPGATVYLLRATAWRCP